jgi:hypothetical protein
MEPSKDSPGTYRSVGKREVAMVEPTLFVNIDFHHVAVLATPSISLVL